MSQTSSEDSRIIKQQAFDIQRQCAKLSETCPDANICFLFLTEGKFYSFQTPNAWAIPTDIAGAALEKPKIPLDADTASQLECTDAQAEQSHISCSGVPRRDSPTLGDTSLAKRVYGPGGVDILTSDAGCQNLSSNVFGEDPKNTQIKESHDPRTSAFPLTSTEHSPEPSGLREQRRAVPESRRHSAQVISGSERHHYGLGSGSRPW